MATQNPIEYEGTYPLPETQLDRFMMKVTVTYPPEDAELDIVRQYSKGAALHDVDHTIESAVISRDELLGARAALDKITVSEEILSYIHKIIIETRDPGHVQLGASPRAAIGLLKSARALAAIRGMNFITPEEVKDVSVPVLRHRVILRPEALIDGLTSDYYLDNILRRVPVPR
jgi:MoxR-like ATPase